MALESENTGSPIHDFSLRPLCKLRVYSTVVAVPAAADRPLIVTGKTPVSIYETPHNLHTGEDALQQQYQSSRTAVYSFRVDCLLSHLCM